MKGDQKICVMLTRVAPTYPGLLDDSEGDERVLSSQYSCLKTATPVGPDHDVADPEACNSARGCYKED